MFISTKGRYALRIMLELAVRNSEDYIPLRELTKSQGISIKYLEAIISVLVKANYVEGLRGKGGGYKLSKSPEEYTVGSILRLTEGSLAPVACLECDVNTCERADKCPTLPMWEKLHEFIDGYFDSITLQDILEDRNLTHKDFICEDLYSRKKFNSKTDE